MPSSRPGTAEQRVGGRRSRGTGVGWGGWVQPWRGGMTRQRIREGKRENSSRPLPPGPPGRLRQEGGQSSQADLTGLGSSRMSGHSEGGQCAFSAPPPSSPIPSCPLRSPKPEAFGPFQQLGQAFGWVRARGGEGSSCHPSPCRQAVGARGGDQVGKSRTHDRTVHTILPQTLTCLLPPSPHFSLVK